jgi:hypothetical protein
VASILTLPLVATQFTDEVAWTLGDFVVVGVLLTIIGVAIEMALEKSGSLATAGSIGALGVLAAIWGMADDAPGLVLLGLVLIASAGALGVRAQRSR